MLYHRNKPQVYLALLHFILLSIIPDVRFIFTSSCLQEGLFTLFVFVCAQRCPTHIVFCLSLSCVPYVVRVSGLSLRLVYPMLAVSLDCPFVLCTRCCPSLWIVPSSCVPDVVRVSGLSIRYSLTFIFMIKSRVMSTTSCI